MPKITHSNQSRGAAVDQSQGQQKPIYVVDDMSDVSDIDRKLQEYEGTATEPSPEPQPTSTTEARLPIPTTPPSPASIDEKTLQESLEELIFMGRQTKEIELAGHKFELSTLTHREHHQMVREVMDISNDADIFVIRIFTLALAIRSIDGKKLSDISVDGKFDSEYHKNIAIIDHLQLKMVERLYEEYESLVKDTNENVFGDNIKN